MTEPRALEAFCMNAVKASGLSCVAKLFHSFENSTDHHASARATLLASDHSSLDVAATTPIQPVGITGVLLLAESHCAIHTWPEKHAVTLDVYVCNYGQDNSAKARLLLKLLMAGFGPAQSATREVVRGWS
jgi:S-adenosylmethionine decarboxylase